MRPSSQPNNASLRTDHTFRGCKTRKTKKTTESKSGSLISDFVTAIKSGIEKVNKYKTDCSAFKLEVSGYADRLKELIKQLEECIGQIENLQNQYVTFIQQLQIIQEEFENVKSEGFLSKMLGRDDGLEKYRKKIRIICKSSIMFI